jgi:hypothetical protein
MCWRGADSRIYGKLVNLLCVSKLIILLFHSPVKPSRVHSKPPRKWQGYIAAPG